jgi:hypothetical protein
MHADFADESEDVPTKGGVKRRIFEDENRESTVEPTSPIPSTSYAAEPKRKKTTKSKFRKFIYQFNLLISLTLVSSI